MNHPVAEWNLYVVSFYYQRLYQPILPFYLHKTWASYKYLDYLRKKNVSSHSLKTFRYSYVIFFFRHTSSLDNFWCWKRTEIYLLIGSRTMPVRTPNNHLIATNASATGVTNSYKCPTPTYSMIIYRLPFLKLFLEQIFD